LIAGYGYNGCSVQGEVALGAFGNSGNRKLKQNTETEK